MASITIPEGASIQDTTRVVYDQPTPSTGPFNVPFPYFENANIKVYLDGVLQSEGAASNEYTLTGVEVDDGFTSGDVDFNDPITGEIIILRSVPVERTSDFLSSGPFPMSLFNVTLDKMFAILQQLRTTIDRTVRLNENDSTTDVSLPPAATRANQYLAFDTNGDPIVASATDLTSTAITPYGQQLIEEATAADARDHLNVYSKEESGFSGRYAIDIPANGDTAIVVGYDFFDISFGTGTIDGLPNTFPDGQKVDLYFKANGIDVIDLGTPGVGYSKIRFPGNIYTPTSTLYDVMTLRYDAVPNEWIVTNYQLHDGKALNAEYLEVCGSYYDLRMYKLTNKSVRINVQGLVCKPAITSISYASICTLSSSDVDIDVIGVNGLDGGSGSKLANAWYYVYGITGKGKTDKPIASINLPSSGPVMPTGYTEYAFIGAFRTDASKQIVDFYQFNNRVRYQQRVTMINLASAPINTWTTLVTSAAFPISVSTIASVNVSANTSGVRFGLITGDFSAPVFGGAYYNRGAGGVTTFGGVFNDLDDHIYTLDVMPGDNLAYYTSNATTEIIANGWTYK